ncbi:MAG TPA: beta-ketoacyl-[acyl-carrier-protein] synthase family protein, partial [Thermoguttaceae bacterium]|nr:beta-ketoacyl-[acyl-carrier-protein] synthase family protein [Thermoguttaceae bacterium]
LGALDDGICHPTINLDSLDPECELPGLVANQPQKMGNITYILNNSFGMLGINSVVIVGKI